MDNNKDRQFYWEVKDFMNRIPGEPKVSQKKPDIVSSVRGILEQNKVYKQTSFEAESNAVGVTQKIISTIQGAEKGYDPKCVGYTKNKDVHAFNSLNEGIFDSAIEKGEGILRYFTGKDPNPLTPEQSRSNARKNVMQGAAKLAPDQFKLQTTAMNQNITSKNVEDFLGSEDAPEAGSSEESNVINMMDRLAGEEEQAAMDSVQSGDYSSTTGTKSNKFADKYDFVKNAVSKMKGSTTPTSTSTETPAPAGEASKGDKTPESDFASGRRKYYGKQNLLKQREAEEKLVRMGTVDVSKLSQAHRATYEVNKLRAQRAAKGEDAMSDEDIDMKVQRDVSTRDRVEREKNVDVSSRLASKYLLNLRDKEGRVKTPVELEAEQEESKKRIASASAPKTETAASNPPASETVLKTNRI